MSKADFSQPGRRVWVFTKFAVLFLAVSLGFGAIWTFVSMSIHRNPYVSSPEVWGGAAYFATDRGVFRFDASSGQKQRIAKIPARWGNVSIGGQRILFWKYRIVRIKGKLRQFEELWIADAEGKGAKPLVRTSQEDSPLFGASIYPTAISPTGDKVVFVARWGQRQIGRDLWCINADGTGLKGYAIGLARDGYNAILGFLEEDRDVLVADAARGKDAWLKGSRLLKVNLETGKAEILTENAHGVQLQPGPDSGGSSRLIAFVFSAGGEPAKELRLIDPRTLEQREIYRADSLSGFRWSQAGDKLAFSVGRSVLGIYSLAEDTITQIKDLPEFDLRWPPYSLDWVPGGELVLKKFNKGAATLCVMDGNLMERKSYAFPFISYHPTELRGADHYVLVRDSERSQIWGLDLKTERWQRIY